MANDETEFRVAYHELGRITLVEVADRLLSAGWSHDKIEKLVREFESRLKDNPQDFGEPLHGIRGTDLTVMVGFVRPVSVQFSLSESRRLVLVRKVTLMTAKIE